MIELTENQQYDLFFDLAKNLSYPLRDVRINAVQAISKIANRRCTNILMDKLKLENDTFIKASLIRILGEIGTENLIEELSRYLNAPEPRLRANAIESLIKIKAEKPQRILSLIRPLVYDENNRVACTALKEIISLGESEYIPLLRFMLKGEDPARKASAIWVVGELGLEQFLEDVLFALYSDNYQVHSIAHRTLGQFAGKAVEPLFDNLKFADSQVKVYTFLFLTAHPDEIPKSRYKELLRLFENEESYLGSFVLKLIYRLTLPEGLELLKANIFSPDPHLRRVSVEGLQYYLSEDGVEELLYEAVAARLEPRLIASLIPYFSGFPGERSLGVLRGLLGHEDSRVVANVIEVLGELGDAHLLDRIRPYLDSVSHRVMANTAVAMFRMGEGKVVEHLKKALTSGGLELRASAAFALGQIGTDEVMDFLLKHIADEAKSVREHIANALMKQDPRIYQGLVSALKSNTSQLSRKALGEVGAKTVARKIPNEKEFDLEMFERAISTLELPDNLEEEEALGLKEMLFSRDPRMRSYAAYVLGEKKVEGILPRLICLLYEQEPEVIGEALLALRKIGNTESLVFVRDVFPRLRGENIYLAVTVMESMLGRKLVPEMFERELSQEHLQALKERA